MAITTMPYSGWPTIILATLMGNTLTVNVASTS
jgi:hypothetical protein